MYLGNAAKHEEGEEGHMDARKAGEARFLPSWDGAYQDQEKQVIVDGQNPI